MAALARTIASLTAVLGIAACGSTSASSGEPRGPGDGSIDDAFAPHDSGDDATHLDGGAVPDAGVDARPANSAETGAPEASPADGSGPGAGPSDSGDGGETDGPGGPDGAAEDGSDADDGASNTAPDAGSDAAGSPESGDGDAATCVVVPAPGDDAGPAPDASSCLSGPTSCAPAVSSFAPRSWIPATQARACSASQIQSFYADCWNGASFAPCQTYLSGGANEVCGACLFTDRAANLLGPVVYQAVQEDAGPTQYFLAPNTAGCVALAEPCNLACAAAMQAEDDCQAAACNTSACASDTDPSAYSSCLSEANACACNGYAQATNGCWDELADPSHPANDCLNMVASQDAFTATAEMFCWNGQ